MSVFNPDPSICGLDRTRLGPHLASWNTLNEILLHDELSDDDLKRLVLLEKEGKNRCDIQKKLVARIMSREKKILLQRVNPHA